MNTFKNANDMLDWFMQRYEIKNDLTSNEFMLTFIIHYNEIGLKGKNREWFEKVLVRNIREMLKKEGWNDFEAQRIFGRIVLKFSKVKNSDVSAEKKIKKILGSIFGIANFSSAKEISPEMASLKKACWDFLKNKRFKTFRVTTQRSNKNFPMTSEEINREVGGYIFDKLAKKKLKPKVSLKNPDEECRIEIVEKRAFVCATKSVGLGGMPVGTSGKALAMLSGGIDSPVASYYGLKRGVKIDFIHFHSLPYTSTASNEKVEALAKKLLQFQINAKIFMVPFAKIQQEIVMKCPEKLRVIMYRRLMLRIAEKIAEREKHLALYSGESVAQVASQTLENILATNDAVNITVLRPLCGFDKSEIIARAQEIGTYEISILPHEDCCTRFVPKHPETRADLPAVRKAEKELDLGKIIREAIEETEIVKI